MGIVQGQYTIRIQCPREIWNNDNGVLMGWRGFPYRLCYYPAKAIKDEDVVSHTEWEFYGKDPVVDYCAFLTPYENLIKVMEYARDK
ncbi:predicted protein [Sclerotinia sclerotiorum 1980 UF-70]|uniref:Uncharacterized protein n=1 Tax=Sclerotinia sclerotiorum (strain ATCC 18683 / 1980 / Ss-1) TaxID=665079 RepID=A7F4G7_SCLS1|nr:predicted protein [Sclerotinia sclerotiorum 1980 UF-70]EDN97638.1 predicted protein [Sclerotinia sclerotiorum 1980 UF-70]